jgi:hypothetical protein
LMMDTDKQELARAVARCVDLIESWAYGPLFRNAGVQWPGGECQAPALTEAKALLLRLNMEEMK